MDSGRSMPRTHQSSFDAPHQTTSSTGSRKQTRKPKKSSNNNNNGLCDGNGRAQGSQIEPAYPLFNNRSLSMISTMHHLNPHRKVAMSPELLREAEEQATTLKKAVKQLQEQLEKANREKARIHRFLTDLLFTLNARGYETVQDHEGTLVDLNKCKGETYLDLKGRDLKQRANVRRQGGQEFLLKAVIGNQERAIQSLMYKLDSVGRDILLANRLCVDDTLSQGDTSSSSAQDGAKIASLEAEVLQLVSLIEGACRKCPEMYPALRDYHYLSEGGEGNNNDMSPRNPVLSNLLRKCEQIAGEATTGQLIDLFNSSTGSKLRPKSRQNTPNSRGAAVKPVKTRSESKSKASNKAPRAVTSDTTSGTVSASVGAPIFQMSDFFGNVPPPPQSATMGSRGNTNSLDDNLLRPLNGGSKSDSSFKDKLRAPSRSPSPSCITRRSCGNVLNNCGGEPTSPNNPIGYGHVGTTTATKFGGDHSLSVTVCPYCHRKFGIEESISEIKNHIEMHIFAGDSVVI